MTLYQHQEIYTDKVPTKWNGWLNINTTEPTSTKIKSDSCRLIWLDIDIIARKLGTDKSRYSSLYVPANAAGTGSNSRLKVNTHERLPLFQDLTLSGSLILLNIILVGSGWSLSVIVSNLASWRIPATDHNLNLNPPTDHNLNNPNL